MNNVSFGDLAQSFLFQRRGVALRTEMSKLTDELASGQVSDVRSVLAGNYSYLSDLERDIKTTGAYGIAATEVRQYATGVQEAMERLQTAGSDLGTSLLNVSQSPLWPAVAQGAELAKGQLNMMLAALNSDLAGRNLFAGTATDVEPLNNMDTLLSALEVALAGAGTPQDIRDAAQDWFDDPAGFEATMYNGSNDSLAPFQLSRDETVQIDIRATDPAFKRLLMNTALAALADSAALAWDQGTMSAVFSDAGVGLINNSEQIVALRGRVGAIEERIEKLTARNAAQATSLEFARGDLLGADPFETATRLESVRFQLEGLYTVTARLSDLALVNFVR